jgi:hypothetical protein
MLRAKKLKDLGSHPTCTIRDFRQMYLNLPDCQHPHPQDKDNEIMHLETITELLVIMWGSIHNC